MNWISYLYFILIPVLVTVEVVHGEERLGVPVLGPHVVLLLPHLLQLILAHRMVRGLVLFVLLLLKRYLEIIVLFLAANRVRSDIVVLKHAGSIFRYLLPNQVLGTHEKKHK